MSITAHYSHAHAGFAVAARMFDCTPMVARVALAIHDRGESATTHELETDLCVHGSAVRRALLWMYEAGVAVGEGDDGKRRRQGVVTRVRLTPAGQNMVWTVLRAARAARDDLELAA
jgi:transcription initiation factor IIE alpha subunit